MKNDTFSKITEEMELLYEKKNAAYDGAFAKRYAKSGLSYAVNKIGEKCDRLSALERNPDIDNLGESIEDTLIDMANYCVMTLMELRK